MTRRWQKPKAPTPQQTLRLEERGRFTPPVKLQPDTAIVAAESIGLHRSGDRADLSFPRVSGARGIPEAQTRDPSRQPREGDKQDFAGLGNLAAAMVGVLERHTSKVRLGGVMLAITVRKEVLAYLAAHPDGATADEIAEALRRTPFTVRPRCSELLRRGLIVDSGLRRENTSGKKAIVWVASTGDSSVIPTEAEQ
jgi:hypothetical protein